MGYNINGPIVRQNLVMAVDAGYSRSYDRRENLVDYSAYNASAWTLPLGNATFTTGIDAPDGTNAAVRFTASTAGGTLLRVNHPGVTTNGTDLYTVSMFVRLISRTTGGLSIGWADTSPSGDYTSSLIANQWVRVSYTAATPAGTRSFIDLIDNVVTDVVIDIWGVQVEKSTAVTDYTPTSGSTISRGTTWTDMISGTTFSSTANTPYSAANGGSFTFTQAASSFVTNSAHPSLNITDNLTLESWVFINSWNNLGSMLTYGSDAAEQYTMFNSSDDRFYFAYNWPGTWYQLFTPRQGSATQRWFHVVSTFVDGTVKIYVNGELSAQTTHALRTLPAAAGAFLTIGNQHPGGDEMLNGRVAIARIYNRALTPTEVSQNFAAHRGRFGI